jgi:hypothetical protein
MDSGASCRGERIPRLCQLVNPSHNDYQPTYLNSLGQIPRDTTILPGTAVVGPGGSILPPPPNFAAPAASGGGSGCGGCGPPRPRFTVPQPPSLAAQVASVGRAAARWVAGGLQFASPEVQASRRAICDACEHHNTRRDKCMICGCFLNPKIRMATESCPLNPPKWPVVATDTPELPSPPSSPAA